MQYLGPPSKRSMKACSTQRAEAVVRRRGESADCAGQDHDNSTFIDGEQSSGMIPWFEQKEDGWFNYLLYTADEAGDHLRIEVSEQRFLLGLTVLVEEDCSVRSNAGTARSDTAVWTGRFRFCVGGADRVC
jgi:hypothetical protein